MVELKDYLPKTAQRGVTAPPAQELLLVALNFVGTDPASCRTSAEALREVIHEEMAGRLGPLDTETGELGFDPKHSPEGLIVTLALSTSGYDRLGAQSADRPIDLHPAPADVLSTDVTGPVIPGEGDVLLHIASDDPFVVEHVLRRIEHQLASDFTTSWTQTGTQRFSRRQKGARKTARALIGFLDGMQNLNMADAGDRGLVFTGPDGPAYPANPTPEVYGGAGFPPDLRPVPTGPEPAQLSGGTYLAIEVLATNTAAFDQLDRSAQEAAVGRQKVDGSLLASPPPNAHVQKANPHRPDHPDDELRRFLRRGYTLLRTDGAGLSRGLIFIGYGRSLTTQVEFARRAWMNNPNFPVVDAGPDRLLFGGTVSARALSGGYYFVPPLAKPSNHTSWVLPVS